MPIQIFHGRVERSSPRLVKNYHRLKRYRLRSKRILKSVQRYLIAEEVKKSN